MGLADREANDSMPSAKMNPSRRWEDQDVEMKEIVVGPAAYTDPNNPDAPAGRLVSLADHPNADSISEDYGKDVGVASATADENDPENMTVEQLDEKYGDVEGYPKSANKDEKVAFARDHS